MKKILFVFLLFSSINTNAQKKHTITQRNLDELTTDLNKAQKGLKIAKGKLAHVETTCRLIAQQKTEDLQKTKGLLINADSVLETIKKQKRRHFNIAENRVKKWQKRFDKINSKYNLAVQKDSVIPNKYNFTPIIQKGLYVSFNPAGILEIQQGAVGLGLGYRVSERVELWTEASYLYRGFATEGDNFKNLSGFRGIISGKYFLKTRHPFFLGVEFRFKQYSYDNKTDFENISTVDTLLNLPYQLKNNLYGGAAFFGRRFKISRSGKFEIEAQAGVGAKYRFVNYNNVPAGYTKINYLLRGPIHLYPDNYFYTEQWVPYFPASIRFVYHF